MARDVSIRRAVEADAGILHELLCALSSEIGYEAAFRADAEALRRHGFGARPLFRAFLAEGLDRALGVAVYFPEFSTLRGQPGVYLQDLYLRPDARAFGLGRRLIGAVVRDAADWQASYLRLAAHTDNEDALAFYDRLGFRSDPRERTLMVCGKRLADLGEIA
jgi:GNAT superfamily N-acetyltransferase